MNRVLLNIMLVMLLSMPALSVQAGRWYKWTDERGNSSYHDTPPPAESGYRVEEKRYVEGPPRDPNESAAAENPIVLYSVPACAMCDAARTYLTKNNIPFSEKNVESDGELQQELKEKSGGLKVPTILVGKEVFDGYVESLLARELVAAGYTVDGKAGASSKKNKSQKNKEEFQDVYRPR